MTDPHAPKAGGALLAFSILAGAILGIFAGQATIGVLAGTAIGVAIAIALWLKDRARRDE